PPLGGKTAGGPRANLDLPRSHPAERRDDGRDRRRLRALAPDQHPAHGALRRRPLPQRLALARRPPHGLSAPRPRPGDAVATALAAAEDEDHGAPSPRPG